MEVGDDAWSIYELDACAGGLLPKHDAYAKARDGMGADISSTAL